MAIQQFEDSGRPPGIQTQPIANFLLLFESFFVLKVINIYFAAQSVVVKSSVHTSPGRKQGKDQMISIFNFFYLIFRDYNNSYLWYSVVPCTLNNNKHKLSLCLNFVYNFKRLFLSLVRGYTTSYPQSAPNAMPTNCTTKTSRYFKCCTERFKKSFFPAMAFTLLG